VQSTTQNYIKIPNLFQVTNLIKQVFSGGGANAGFPRINFTSYVESASRLFPKPIANQVLSFAKLVASNRQTIPTTTSRKVVRTRPTTTAAPSPLIIVLPPSETHNGQAIVNGHLNATEALNHLNNLNGTQQGNGQGSVWNIFIPSRASRPPPLPPTLATTKAPLAFTTSKAIPTTAAEEDDDDDDYYTDENADGARQLQILNTITSLLSSGIQGLATSASQASNAVKVEQALREAEVKHLAALAAASNMAAVPAAGAAPAAAAPATQTQIVITSSGSGGKTRSVSCA